MADAKSKLHIKKELPDLGITVNAFADTPDEALDIIVRTIGLAQGDIEPRKRPNQAQREMANAQNRAGHRGNGGSVHKGQPCCQECGSDEAMELIRWTDRNTGEPKQAWKCQACNSWAKQYA